MEIKEIKKSNQRWRHLNYPNYASGKYFADFIEKSAFAPFLSVRELDTLRKHYDKLLNKLLPHWRVSRFRKNREIDKKRLHAEALAAKNPLKGKNVVKKQKPITSRRKI